MTAASAVFWPPFRAAEGLELLARSAGLPVEHTSKTHDKLADHIASAATSLGLEVEPFDASFDEIEKLLRSAGPAVIRIGDDGLVMLVGSHGARAKVVGPDHRIAWVPVELLRRALVDPEATPLIAETERVVAETGVRSSRRAAVVRALVGERLRSRRLRAGWLVRIPTAARFRAQLIAMGARRQLILLAAAHTAQYVLWIVAWWLLGRAALQGHLDSAWLGAWTLALFTLIPLQLAAFWLQGRLSIVVGALLKQRLLAGAFLLEPEETRREGAGHLLGRVIEAQAVESLALGGGFMALFAAMELVLAAGVLALASALLPLLLLVWTGVAIALGAVFFRRRLAWVRLRIRLTLDLIERMVGHRTRIAQQRPENWHAGEDEAIERYVDTSTAMDRAAVSLIALVPRGWMLVGLCGLTPLFLAGGSAVSMAIGLGGIVLAFRAFDRLTTGVWSLAGAAIAWQQTAPVFRAASRGSIPPSAPPAAASIDAASPPASLDATDLRFTHAGRSDPVLSGCTIAIGPGERVILQGPSGGGKSTLASLLAGLRTPQSGLLLLDGLDRHTLGPAGWRRRVVLVPQFHENHLVLGSVAFNVLMGVEWPPSEADFARADSVLRELGLGPTLDRMPSGLLQTIGETGWQLSHGERSRLYLARALLQKPDVLILDESFAQLDPENMKLALDVVAAQRSSVLLIAHP
jgi:ATP-binding cassette subfamily B protein